MNGHILLHDILKTKPFSVWHLTLKLNTGMYTNKHTTEVDSDEYPNKDILHRYTYLNGPKNEGSFWDFLLLLSVKNVNIHK